MNNNQPAPILQLRSGLLNALPTLVSRQFKCCGSNGSSDWAESIFIRSGANGRLVPDSCCKTSTELCGLRDHPSNIYKVEVRPVEGAGVANTLNTPVHISLSVTPVRACVCIAHGSCI